MWRKLGSKIQYDLLQISSMQMIIEPVLYLVQQEK